MKKNLLLFLLALSVISCKKIGNEGSPSTLDGTDYAILNLKTHEQVVKISVSGNVLNMVYNEDVIVLINSSAMPTTCAIHLKEDFTGTNLATYDYHSLASNGTNALNWVDDNLNNVIAQSSKDTLIAGKKFVRKHITRAFVYQKSYTTATDAGFVLNQLLKQTDIITFVAYYSPANPETATITNTAKLTYLNVGKDMPDFTTDKS